LDLLKMQGEWSPAISRYSVDRLRADNNVVDGDVDQFDEEADEAHDGEADGCGDRNLLEL
jgi:hypothetical protein